MGCGCRHSTPQAPPSSDVQSPPEDVLQRYAFLKPAQLEERKRREEERRKQQMERLKNRR